MDELLKRVGDRVERLRQLRDEDGWPEPRTVEDLRRDPRVQLRNVIGGAPEDENLVLAAALILLVESDRVVAS